MSETNKIISVSEIHTQIHTVRGLQVMIDMDLSKLYNVETRVLNQAVKRNIKRFPERFRFQLTKEEFEKITLQNKVNETNSNLKSQIVISSENHGGRRKLPFVFTEQGISMLSSVLKSDIAIDISIQIMDAFIQMRKFIANNFEIFQRLNGIEQKQLETDNKFNQIFKALESKEPTPNKGIYFDGQTFDAYTFVADLIRTANKSIILIDNYIDDTVLTILSKRNTNVKATIYTKEVSKQLSLDLKKHNAQYPKITIKKIKETHDRFLIIDDKELYHIGASIKDLGKKWFAFSKFENSANSIIEKLK